MAPGSQFTVAGVTLATWSFCGFRLVRAGVDRDPAPRRRATLRLSAGCINGVCAANDGLAAGSIAALKANKSTPLSPVTGQDAELAAVRLIVSGDQYMTVHKPFGSEAAAAGAMALAAARGQRLDGVTTRRVKTRSGAEVPAVLLTPVPVILATIKNTVVKDGVYTLEQICPRHSLATATRPG
ncbi:substrate-binding domain-containing protein [Streptomyces sp. NPDC001980]|uniref:substrate-binding domain-containing protein n=1 Tax=Streptomyces sp. NPDC001980 TaxID=3157126 RepID=UPI00332EBD34